MPTGAPVGSISFVTGVDHRMFDQLFPLMGSMRRYCPGTRLWVCDFGLTGQQKDLLHRMGVLLEMPAGLGRYDHAWYYKGALGRYVATLCTEALVWIDVDIVVVCDIVPRIRQINASMAVDGDILAAAGNETIASKSLWTRRRAMPVWWQGCVPTRGTSILDSSCADHPRFWRTGISFVSPCRWRSCSSRIRST
jgi:hypothetical protein